MEDRRRATITGAQVNYSFLPDAETPSKQNGVVISGISCRLPESNNMAEFEEHLMKGEDMVTEDDRRWDPGLHGLPPRSGKLKDLCYLDASFFGIPPKHVNAMDPQLRMLIEVSYEAIVDAGVSPSSLKGRRVAVIVGCSDSETMEAFGKDVDKLVGYELTGCNKSMFANRLSFIYGIDGPSYSIDQACSSSLLALNHAFELIRSGQCEAAIVGGTNLNLRPGLSKLFHLLGMTSETGACRSFDEHANGFCRGEGMVCIYVQRSVDAKRQYASVVNIGSNVDGAKVQGITFPSGEKQQDLWERIYSECQIAPSDVTYVEAHCTGTPVGDPQEGNAIDRVYCKEPRQTPLLVGSVKSNMGHAEPAAGVASLAKVIIAIERGIIPPNLHFNSPNPNIPGLTEGRMKVVAEPTEWRGGYMAVNSSGFGGTNVTALLESNRKKATGEHPAAGTQRLVIYCARTEEGLEAPLKLMHAHPRNVELHSLLQETALSQTTLHPYRGFTVVNSNSSDIIAMKVPPSTAGSIWFIFPGMGTKWHGMGRDLMTLDVFRNSIEQCHHTLKAVGLNLQKLLMEGEEKLFKDVTNTFVCIIAIQVALVDTLKVIGVDPDGMIGHSVGELVCGYADGCLTKSQTLLAAYWRGHSIKTSGVTNGAMAAVGMTWEEANARCPEGVVAACHNAENSVTISGKADAMSDFVQTLITEGRFVKEVDSNRVPFHSPYLLKAGSTYSGALQKIIKTPRERSPKWISTSIREPEWDSQMARQCSAEYHAHNFLSPVRFHEAVQHIPQGALVIEIAPHSILQNILKKSLGSSSTVVSLMKREDRDGLHRFLSSCGKLYTAGVNINPLKLYKAVQYPVPRGTPMISPTIKWDHSQKWRVPRLEEFYTGGKPSGSSYTFELDSSTNGEEHYLVDHVIDGRLVLPVAECIVLAWRAFGKMRAQDYQQLPVAIKHLDIRSPTIVPKAGKLKIVVHITPEDGFFKVSEGNTLLVTGYISAADSSLAAVSTIASADTLMLKQSDVYKDLRLRGYQYGPMFQGILRATCDGERGQLRWDGLWVPFLDTVLQFPTIGMTERHLMLPRNIKQIHIDPKLHADKITSFEDGLNVVETVFDRAIRTSTAGGVRVFGLEISIASRSKKTQADPVIERYQFVPFQEVVSPTDNDLFEYLQECELALSIVLQSPIANQLPNAELLRQHVRQCSTDTRCPKTLPDSTDLLQNQVLNLAQGISAFVKKPENDASLSLLESARGMIDPSILQKDKLLGHIRQPRTLKTSVDSIWQTIQRSATIRFHEYRAEHGYLFMDVLPQMASHAGVISKGTVLGPHSKNLHMPNLESYGVGFQQWDLGHDPPSERSEATMVLASYFSVTQENLQESLTKLALPLKDTAFILLCEPTKNFAVPLFLACFFDDISIINDERTCGHFCDESKWQDIIRRSGLKLVSHKSDGIMHTLFVCMKDTSRPSVENSTIIPISSSDYEWVSEVKGAMGRYDRQSQHRIWLTAEGDPYSGIIGMVNCLRLEPNGEAIRCLFRPDGGSVPMCQEDFEAIFQNDLAMNVWQNETFGAFIHVPFDKEKSSKTRTDSACLSIGVKGDISTLSWVVSPHVFEENKNHESFCEVVYAAVNHRDVLYATGRLSPDDLTEEQAKLDNLLGMEFSGRTPRGKRVMGLVPAQGMGTHVFCKHLLPVPEHWSLEEAATVPYVYASAYLALVMRARMQRKQRILIHSGASLIGQAAISISSQLECEIFISIRSQDERVQVQKCFPDHSNLHFVELNEPQFHISLLRASDGQPMDIMFGVEGEAARDSSWILDPNGHLLEVGPVKSSDASVLVIGVSVKVTGEQNIVYHGVHLDRLLGTDSEELEKVLDMVSHGIQDGTVKPLCRKTFSQTELSEAFSPWQDKTKILLKILEDTGQPGTSPTLTVKARVICHPSKSYVLTGGLGGLGLELANWLVQRGARCLILCSRSGIRNGYQALFLRRWREAGITVEVLAKDICNLADTTEIIKQAKKFGPVGGVFHLAMVLRDGYMDKQTEESFAEVCDPKVKGILNLDSVTRAECSDPPDLFVAFSSISCGQGNAGQSPYGYGNSVMERVCEQRKRDGLPGTAIQFGAIGDVGVVFEASGARDDVTIGGTVPQSLTSFLASLDLLLNQPYPVVTSHVPAKFENKLSGRNTGAQDTVDTVAKILGIDDPSTVRSDQTLVEIGVDSLMILDIRQSLEKEAGILMTPLEVQDLTFGKLRSMVNETPGITQTEEPPTPSQPPLNRWILEHYDLETLMPMNSLIRLNSPTYHPKQSPPVFVVSPIEGTAKILSTLASKVEREVYGLQCSEEVPLTSIKDMAAFYIKELLRVQKKGPYAIAGYSFGACVAFEMVAQLETAGRRVSCLFMFDGSQKFISEFRKKKHLVNAPTSSRDLGVDGMICVFIRQFVPLDFGKMTQELLDMPEWQSRLKHGVDYLLATGHFSNSCDVSTALNAYCTRMQIGEKHSPVPVQKLKCPVVVIKASDNPQNARRKDTTQENTRRLEEFFVPGDHRTFLLGRNAEQVAEIVNKKVEEFDKLKQGSWGCFC